MFSNPATRKWIYGITIALIPILATVGLIDDSDVALWAGLSAAIFAPVLAIGHVAPSINETARDEEFTAEDFQ